MKVYVENLPKKCGDCPCCSGNQYCNYMWEHYTDTEKPHFDECNLKDYCKVPYDFNNNMKKYKEWLDNLPKNNDEQHKNCPLQTISNHDKQVRKEVCEEIRSRFLATCQIEKGCDTASFSLEVLNKILDKLQKDKQ